MNRPKASGLNKVVDDIPGVSKLVVVEKKKLEPAKEADKPPKETIPDYARGYVCGFEYGFKLGLEKQPNSELLKRLAFDQGVKHIVTLAENFLVKELKLASRDELTVSGKIPTWWIATLTTELCEKPQDKTVE